MTTFTLTLDEKVWADIDSVIEETDSNRVEFLKEAVAMALRQYRTRQPERQDKWDEDPAWLSLDDEQITEKLNEFTAVHETKIDPELMQMQVQAIDKDDNSAGALAAVERLSNLFADVEIDRLEEMLNDPMIELANADLDTIFS